MCYFITLFCAWKAPNSHYFSSLFLFKILATVKTNNFPYFLKRSAKNEMKLDLVRETFLEDELGNPLRDLRQRMNEKESPAPREKFACIFKNSRFVHSNFSLKKGKFRWKIAQRFAGNRGGENKNLTLIFKVKFRKHQAI